MNIRKRTANLFISILIIFFGKTIFSETFFAKLSADVELFSDYKTEEQISSIKKNEIVRVLNKIDGHKEDANYWGFDRSINNGSIRIEYKNTKGYIKSSYLESIDQSTKEVLGKFRNKVLIPEFYWKAFINNDIEELKRNDPFLENYDNGIEYSFSTDIHKEWYYNYPVNNSYLNDVYFQFSSKPYRYSISGFIKKCSNGHITCIIDSSFDQFNIYEGIQSYLPGNQYTFSYLIDGDHLQINDGRKTVFSGVFIYKNTWQDIYSFIKESYTSINRSESK